MRTPRALAQPFVFHDGIAGTPGAPGPPGANGAPGIEVDATPPVDTTILWADTSEPGDMVLPLGGSTGQALVKVSGSDYDTAWANALSPWSYATLGLVFS